jgi:cytochrome b subunit of formate dehydrogenase
VGVCCNCDVGRPVLNVFFWCERQFHWLVVSCGSTSHCKGMTLSKIDFDKGIPIFMDKVHPLPVWLALKRGAGIFGKIG